MTQPEITQVCKLCLWSAMTKTFVCFDKSAGLSYNRHENAFLEIYMPGWRKTWLFWKHKALIGQTQFTGTSPVSKQIKETLMAYLQVNNWKKRNKRLPAQDYSTIVLFGRKKYYLKETKQPRRKMNTWMHVSTTIPTYSLRTAGLLSSSDSAARWTVPLSLRHLLQPRHTRW